VPSRLGLHSLHSDRALCSPGPTEQAGCEYGRVVADLFPEDSTHCFCSVEPKFKQVTDWKPLIYSRLVDGYLGVQSVDAATLDDAALQTLADGMCCTLGTLSRNGHGSAGGWGRVLLLSSRVRDSRDAARLGVALETAMDKWNTALRDSLRDTSDGSRQPIHHCEVVCSAVRCEGKGLELCASTTYCPIEPEHVLRSAKVSVISHTVQSVHAIPFAHHMVQAIMNLRQVLVSGLEMKLPGGDKSKQDVALFCTQSSDILLASAEGYGPASARSGAASVPASGAAADAKAPEFRRKASDSLVLNKVAGIKQLKSKSGMLLPISAAHRVTPVDLHSDATTCFVKFLLAGNDTCLAVDTGATSKKKDKALSKIQCTHILIGHSGALFLHCLDGSHTMMESLPTIERCAGSGIDLVEYRVQPMAELLRKFTVKVTSPIGSLPPRANLLLDTDFFPLCRSQGIIFEYQEFELIVRAVVSDSMDWHAFDGCQKLLLEIEDKRSANDGYCFERVPRSHLPGLYTRVFEEISLLTQAYRKVSPNHEKIAVIVAKMIERNEEAEQRQETRKDKRKSTVWDEVDRIGKMTEREKADVNSGDKNNSHFAKRRKGTGGQAVKLEGQSDIMRQIQTFYADKSRTVLSLPRTLTSAQRREAHEAAETLGMAHISKGDYRERHIVISKEAKKGGSSDSSAAGKIGGGGITATASDTLAGIKMASSAHKQDAKKFAGWT